MRVARKNVCKRRRGVLFHVLKVLSEGTVYVGGLADAVLTHPRLFLLNTTCSQSLNEASLEFLGLMRSVRSF